MSYRRWAAKQLSTTELVRVRVGRARDRNDGNGQKPASDDGSIRADGPFTRPAVALATAVISAHPLKQANQFNHQSGGIQHHEEHRNRFSTEPAKSSD